MMGLWVIFLLFTGIVSAHHNEFHHSEALPYHSEPQQTLSYAIPIQLYSAQSVPAPAAELYSAPQPAVYSAQSPQIFTATIAPPAQVYAAVAPAPQYAVHNVEVQSYSAPTYSAPSYLAPSYSAQSYLAPSYSAQSYSAPTYSAPSYSAQSYSAPTYSAKSYSAPSYSAQSPILKHNFPQHSSTVSSSSSQFKSPVKTLTKTSLPSSSVKTYSSIYKSSYSSAVKPHTAAQYSAGKYEAPSIQYHAPAVMYQTPAINQYSYSAYSKPIAILRQSQDDGFDGSFNYEFQAENGIQSSASGHVKQLSPKEQAQVIEGQYSYTAPDGTPVVTRWFADETGFHAEGSHLPVPPAVPEAIAKSLTHQGIAY